MHILHLDRDAAEARLIERELRRGGLQVTYEHVDGRAAYVLALSRDPPDVILADYALPDIDGPAALSLARDRCPDAPFVFVSGSIGETQAVEGVRRGATDYVHKDHLERLVPVVRRALEDRGREQDRRRAEQELVEANSKYTAIIEDAVEGIIQSIHGRVTLVNPALVRMLGYESSVELLAALTDARNLWMDLDERERFYELARTNGAVAGFPASLRRRDGTALRVETNARALLDSDGVVIGLEGFIVDVSAREDAEWALRERMKELQCLFRVASDAQRRDSLSDLCESVVQNLVEAMQFPDKAVAVVEIDGDRVESERFSAGLDNGLLAPIAPFGAARGHVGVYYVHDLAFLLPEEQSLVDSVAETLRLWVERRENVEVLNRRDAILAAVAYASEQYLRADDWQECIGEVSRRLGEASGAQRVRLIRHHYDDDGKGFATLLHQWLAPEFRGGEWPTVPVPYQELGFGGWFDRMMRGEVVHGRSADMPEPARSFLESQGTVAYVAAPVFVGSEPWGLFGLDDATGREWSPGELDAVKAAADLLGAAVSRQQTEEELQRSEEQFRLLADNARDFVYRYRVDPDLRFEYVSPSCETLTGYTPQEYYADPDLGRKLVHPDDARLLEAVFEHPERTSVLRWIRKDGAVIWAEQRGTLVCEAGRVVAVEGIARDVTERVLAEQAVRESHERLSRTLDSLTDGFMTVDSAFRVTYLNPAGEALVGHASRDIAGKDVWQVFPTAAHFVAPERALAALQSGGAITTENFDSERQKWFEVNVCPTPDGLSVFFRDVTARRRAAEELQESYDLLRRSDEERRELLKHLVDAQEDERRRIASDIHDDSIQVVSALGIRLQAFRRHIDDPDLLDRLGRIEATAQAAVTRLRALMFELRPPALDREGLASALRAYLDRLAAETKLEWALDNQMERDSSIEVRTIAFRVVQEALANVGKHSGAGSVRVTLQERDEGILVTVRDDGAGFSTDLAQADGHIGLTSMRERAELGGGRLRIESIPGGGTTVELWLPDSPVSGAA